MLESNVRHQIPKAIAAGGANVAAAKGAAGQAVHAATGGVDVTTWAYINSLPWDDWGKMAAAIFAIWVLGEKAWKDVARPIAERRGWLKPKRVRRIVEEVVESDAAPLGKS